MNKLNLTTEITLFESIAELKPDEQELVRAANKICKKAYAPYSDFRVGAALRLKNGKIISGNNQENAAYPSGLCAERVAMFYANAQYPDVAVESIAIIAMNSEGVLPNPVAPCGACRQVLLETEIRTKQAFDILLVGANSISKINSSKDLLPLSFIGEGLKKGSNQ